MDRLTGIILKGVGGRYTVSVDDAVLNCSLDGKLRLGKDVPVPGDIVDIGNTRGSYHICKLHQRKNSLIRPAISNIDRLFVVASNSAPKTDPYLIDKMSVIASLKNIEMIILLSKSDLDSSDNLYNIYCKAGFKVVRVSAITGEGIDEVKDFIRGNISAFTGNSGIGKSSILNKIDPRFGIAIGDISKRIERGKHTTRHVELLKVEDGYVADTPGFSSFEITKMDKLDKKDLQYHFPEINVLIGQCRFTDCVHMNEPDCPIKAKLQDCTFSNSRYESYRKIYEELSNLSEY